LARRALARYRAAMRRRLLPLVVVIVAACATRPAADLEALARALTREFVLVDTHIDVPWRLHEEQAAGRPMEDVGERTARGDFDWPRAVEGGLDAAFFSIFTPAECEAQGSSKRLADELIDGVEGLLQAHPERFVLARTAAEVRAAARAGRIALLLGMENGSPLEGSLANLEHFYARGVRYITLCHGEDNHICDSSYDTRHTHRGLTAFGREVVARMNELGILVDVSHVSDDTFWQVLELSRAPVIASHSSLRHFVTGFERNLSDDMVRALGARDGVVQINFGSGFLTEAANGISKTRWEEAERFAKEHGLDGGAPQVEAHMQEWDGAHPFPFADVQDVADHIERVIRLVGVDHVGFGSDFDGVGPTLPTGLEDVSKYPNLVAELLRRGHSERDIQKICGENLLRVLEAAERVAR
jgi:membrane dipeptidase